MCNCDHFGCNGTSDSGADLGSGNCYSARAGVSLHPEVQVLERMKDNVAACGVGVPIPQIQEQFVDVAMHLPTVLEQPLQSCRSWTGSVKKLRPSRFFHKSKVIIALLNKFWMIMMMGVMVHTDPNPSVVVTFVRCHVQF